MKVAWVLGKSGLLGSALCRSLSETSTELFFPSQSLAWGRPQELPAQIQSGVREFAIRCQMADQWEIHWAAGIGTMGSAAEALAAETFALTLLLELLIGESRLKHIPGRLSFASSAGAIYAGTSDDIISENTDPAPTTDYATEKLRQEELVKAFVTATPGSSALIARISTIYGQGQSTGKKQGLLSYIARSIIRNQPVQIYVPYDTIRDYIDADDVARAMLGSMRAGYPGSRVLTTIIASEQPTTIAEIISVFKRLARRAPLVVRSANKLNSLYSRRIQFRSIVLPIYDRRPTKKLAVGIAQLMRAEYAAYIKPLG